MNGLYVEYERRHISKDISMDCSKVCFGTHFHVTAVKRVYFRHYLDNVNYPKCYVKIFLTGSSFHYSISIFVSGRNKECQQNLSEKIPELLKSAITSNRIKWCT